jgi:hypothetical protein
VVNPAEEVGMSTEDKTQANDTVLRRYGEIMASHDYDRLEEVLHPEYVAEWPQSRERVRGARNMQRIMEDYPGGRIDYDVEAEVLGDQPRYAMTPTFQLVKIAGTGDRLTSWGKGSYPDGSEWYIVTISTFEDEKIIRQVEFFAPIYEAPDWRAHLVELM